MKTKKLLALLLAGAMSASLLAGCGGGNTNATENTDSNTAENTEAESDLAYVQEKGTLVVGITEFEPMDYQNADGEWIGFDADMAKAFAESLEFSYRNDYWISCYAVWSFIRQ